MNDDNEISGISAFFSAGEIFRSEERQKLERRLSLFSDDQARQIVALIDEMLSITELKRSLINYRIRT